MAFDFSLTWNAIRKGEISALKTLFLEIGQPLINYSFRLTHDKFLAEEIVQDVFVTLWGNREQINISKSLKTYLYQSVHNQSINKLIQNNNLRNSLQVLVSEESWQYIENNYQLDDHIIERIESEETEKQIFSLIENLPVQCRQVFWLSRFENLSNQEIAVRLNLSISTVKTQIYRAVEKIKQELF